MNATSQKLAHWFILKSKEDAKPLTPAKLMKLAVFACYEYVWKFKEPLLNESVEAWENGPVIPSLHHEYKEQQAHSPIENPSRRQSPLEADAELEAFLQSIWKDYGKYTTRQLDRISQQTYSPWSMTLGRSRRENHPAITESILLEYYDSIPPADA